MKEDKIFNNRFNTGEMDFDLFGAITKIDVGSANDDDNIDEYTGHEFQKTLYEIFLVSPFYEEYSKHKKVPKNEAAKIYYYFEERIPHTKDLSKLDLFIHIAEFMTIEYGVLYNELGAPSKELLLKELDVKYNIFKKRNIRRLF